MNRMCGLPAADTLLTLPIMDASAMVRPTTPNIVAGERHEYSTVPASRVGGPCLLWDAQTHLLSENPYRELTSHRPAGGRRRRVRAGRPRLRCKSHWI